MNAFTMMRLRPWVQGASLLTLVYGAGAVGHYMAEKLSNALPALSCAYDKENAGYCVLIPLQHQLHHRLGEGLVKMQAVTAGMVMPLVFTMLTFLAFFIVLNKAFCGWICPLGTVQEWIYKAGRLLGLTTHHVPEARRRRVSSIKWAVLVLLVLVLPLVSGMGFLPHAFRDPWCQICPSRIVTTLLTADAEQVAMPFKGDWSETVFAAIRNLVFGFGAVFALTFRQPFCRICPMLSLHALFRRFAPLRLAKKASSRCDRCGLCAKACPMDIKEVQTEVGAKAFHEDCTLCGRCVAFCPEDGTLSLALGPLPLVRSSKEAFARMTRKESPEGDAKRAKARRVVS
ncbi:MAG TPA: 4Fe-4S binding protein [Candidatus Omnitrophota bacterium]|nr:4Fe-4S binding protein [Candidatus Omnitrophota bacterium]